MDETTAAQTHDDERRIRDVVAEAGRAQSDTEALLALHTLAQTTPILGTPPPGSG